ncbi:MAG TPA: hypothetical protein VGP36_13770 [Mycobacteriales bacterium]|nr:hypothetical protein [Mycobacteriales bacterium]
MKTRRATTMSSILAAAALLAAGCTGTGAAGTTTSGTGPSSPTEQQAAPAAVVAAPSAATLVAPGRTPAQITTAVSRSLFTSAPAVVVASSTDPDALSRGSEQAERLGVPLLLTDGTAATTAAAPSGPTPTGSAAGPTPTGSAAGSTPTGTAAGSSPAAADPVATEVARLKPTTVLALGPGVADLLAPTGIKVVTDPATMPPLALPEPLSDTAVLISAAPGLPAKATALAVTTTAKAAGARAVPVVGGDPRTDSRAIEDLSTAKPAHVVAAGTAFGATATLAARIAVATTGVQLPGGGQVVLPGRRLVAMYGYPGSAGLGVLGEQPLPQAIARAKRLAAPYVPLSGDTPVVPTFELIATVAQANPGVGGDYSYEAPVSLLKPWVDAAGKAGMYVVLDLQPGRANLLDQAKIYEPLLKNPHVGLALDPEWRITDSQLPLQQIGSAKAAEINSVYRWLADLTAKNTLPQKLFVIHEFRLSMIGDDEPLQHDRDQVQLLIHMDGQGPTNTKDSTWAAVVGAAPKGVPFGWKNFYDEDTPMLTPAQTMIRKPTPSMISYQ